MKETAGLAKRAAARGGTPGQQFPEQLESGSVRLVRVAATDLDGQLRGKLLDARKLLSPSPIAIPNVLFAWDVQDNLYDPNLTYTSWETGWPDFEIRPDWSTFRPIPWHPGLGVVLADLYEWDGAPVEFSPRELLRRQVQEAHVMGISPKFAVEFEFIVLQETSQSLRDKAFRDVVPASLDTYTYSPDRATVLRAELTDRLSEFGIPIDGSTTEWGPGQFEINMGYADPMEAADQAVLFKAAVKELVQQHGLIATFMARVHQDQPGNSGHLHQSLWDRDGDKSLFWSEDEKWHMSSTMRSYAAGLLASMKEFAPLFLPNVNSYRRVREYSSSPTSVSWGIENRSTALRVIAHNEKGVRLEHRVAGADATPYLTIAACLAGGLHGIRNNLIPPELHNFDAYRPHEGMQTLPRNLKDALAVWETGEFAKQAFGENFVRHYSATRRWELDQFAKTVTEWERSRYLEKM